MKRIEMRMQDALLWVGEREQATGKIRPRVALEFEHHWLGTAFDPDFATHNPVHTVVNLPAHHAVMNAKGHAWMMHGPGTGDNIYVAQFSGAC